MFGISEADPTIAISVTTFLLLLTLGAAFVPARRAAAVDPIVSLRAE